jgi:hypothetical protein
MSLSSFPRSVPRSGAALCSTGSLGLVPQRLCSYCGTPTSRSPASLTHCASLSRSVSRRRKRELPSSSATLATHAPVSDLGRAYPSRPPGLRPYVLLSRSCLPGSPYPSASTTFHFGVQFRGLRACCLRFVSVVAFRSRKTRFRLAALPWPDGTSTRWVANLVSVWLAYMTHLQDEACLAHGCGDEGRARTKEARGRGLRPSHIAPLPAVPRPPRASAALLSTAHSLRPTPFGPQPFTLSRAAPTRGPSHRSTVGDRRRSCATSNLG